MPMPIEPLAVPHDFRAELYACLGRRRDALFELGDALPAGGPVPSPAHLSLEAPHRRGWGGRYAALARGAVEGESLRTPLARHPLTGGVPIYAVDVSVWPRCDAEASPERDYSYHPSRHSAGQPIVAGWAYRWVAQLGLARDSWTAAVDARRVHPLVDTNAVAAAQVAALAERLPTDGPVPLFVFDAGYDPTSGASATSSTAPCACGRGPAGTPSRGRVAGGRCGRPSRWCRARRSSSRSAACPAAPGSRRCSGEPERRRRGTVRGRPISASSGAPTCGASTWSTPTGRPPRVRSPLQADRWTWLVVAAYTQLRLARPLVGDRRLPWERPVPRDAPTPRRVRRAFPHLPPALGTPAGPPKPCGRPPGRPRGRRSGRAARHPALKRTA